MVTFRVRETPNGGIEGASSDGESFYPSPDGFGGRVVKAALADPWKAILINNEEELCVVTAFNSASYMSDGVFERVFHSLPDSRSFQQTLLYSGKIGNKINIGYREFSNSMVRPAFNNDVQYDLSESSVIGYKGARLEVIEATNEFIKFKMLQNFNQAVR